VRGELQRDGVTGPWACNYKIYVYLGIGVPEYPQRSTLYSLHYPPGFLNDFYKFEVSTWSQLLVARLPSSSSAK
jgi:hypothetical protein